MTNKCQWLPATIEKKRNETSDGYFSRLYDIFDADFNKSHPQFMGKDVIYDRNKNINGNYERMFVHLVTVDDHSTHESEHNGCGTIDYARAEKLPWIKEVIEHHDCNIGCCEGIKTWNEKRKYYILFVKERYFIVLRKQVNNYHLETAYYINWPGEYDNYLRRYQRYTDTHK